MYVNTAKLMGQMKLAKAKGTVLSDLKRIERMDVSIMDDFRLQFFDAQSWIALRDVIEDRNQKHSTIITSQRPVKEWYDASGEPTQQTRCRQARLNGRGARRKTEGQKTIADAVPDRSVNHSLRVELYGESLRNRKNKDENGYVWK